MPMPDKKRLALEQLFWSDEQWEAYHAEMVTIPREFFDYLVMAAELMADGTRPDETCRAAWAEVVEKVKSIETEEV